jgi:hypothetical protein
VEAFAIRPLEGGPAGRAAGEFAHGGIRLQGIHVGHLLPEFARGPAHRVQYPVDPGDMAPAAAAALRAEQLLQPFVAEHQHRIGLDHQLRPFVAHAPRLQLLRREQMQEILLAVALNPLFRVGRAEQLPPLGPAVPARLDAGRGAGAALLIPAHGAFAG